jgi:hypothetical protein
VTVHRTGWRTQFVTDRRVRVAWLSTGGRAWVAIDRLPSGSFRGRLMIDGRRYTAPLPTEADARIWEIETRAAVAGRCRAASVTFAAYAANWLSGFIEDAPDRARFDAALEDRLVPVLGEVRLLEVLDADRDQLHRRLVTSAGAMMAPRASACA